MIAESGADFREQALIAEQPGPTVASPVVAPGRGRSRLASALRLLGHVYDWLGFDAVGDAVFRNVVIARIVEPISKLDASRVLSDLGAQPVSYKPSTAMSARFMPAVTAM